jgi:hypothetical protein
MQATCLIGHPPVRSSVIASVAKQSIYPLAALWIASSQALLAMTVARSARTHGCPSGDAQDTALARPRFYDSKTGEPLKEIVMRVLIWAMLAVAVGLMTAPARAQTYDPRYPFCVDVHDGNGGYMDCSYYTREQCAASASGRAAECLANPFFAAGRPAPAAPRYPSRRFN